jgi:iron-sulfur cluster assembly protein
MSSKTDEKGKFDELVEEKGVRILIEPTAVMHLLGTRMNFVEDKLRYDVHSFNAWNVGMFRAHFKRATSNATHYVDDIACRAEFIFENPQAKGTCGCGESFTT